MNDKKYPTIDLEGTGRNIMILRQKNGLTVAEVQSFCGFDAPQAVYKWQKGLCLPSIDNLCALAVLFDVPIDTIVVYRQPPIQSLPQDDSCGSGRFGTFSFISFSMPDDMAAGFFRFLQQIIHDFGDFTFHFDQLHQRIGQGILNHPCFVIRIRIQQDGDGRFAIFRSR